MQCGCCNQSGCLYSWGVYFLWVLIIPDFTVAWVYHIAGYFHGVLIFVTFMTSSGVTKFGTHKFSTCTMNCMNCCLGRVLFYYCILLTVL